MTSNAINVEISFHDNPIKVDITENTTVEDVITEVCKILKIKPVTRTLFALKNTSLSCNAWLSLSHRIAEDKIKKHYEFAIRFRVPNVKSLRSIDINTYNFYFRQVKQSILRNITPSINIEEHESAIIGLGVCDMLRAIVEDNLTRQQVIKNYRNYVPTSVLRKHRFFLKKPVIQSFEEVRVKDCDVAYLKNAYLEQFEIITPNYLAEEFNALIVRNDNERLYSVVIRVNPYHEEQPGISIKQEYKEWEHVCSIEDLCYISTRSNGTVEIMRKNGIPMYLKFQMITDMTSFVTLLDGYYRLTTKWTFNICNDFPTPSLQRLRALRCHGPVSGEFAYRKLAEKTDEDNKVGSYILRECDSNYDSYYIDVYLKSSPTPITFKIEKTNIGGYRLSGEEEVYQSILDLIKDHRSEKKNVPLLRCVPPSEFDESNLLLCKVENSENLQSPNVDEELSATSPVCIDTRSLWVFKNVPKISQSFCTTVYPGVWKNGTFTKDVAIKVLEKHEQQKYLPEFLNLASRWAIVNVSSAIKLYGVSLSNPVSMVMEYLPLGPLNVYLANNIPHIKEVNLVEAATYLANALYYLAEVKVVHGYIRCRKLLVAAHTDDSFVVKLADPGLDKPYTDFDLHWIPPEFHNDPNVARQTSRSDVWAFATTLWEIFSYGAIPCERDVAMIKKFYSCFENHLPIPNGCPKAMYQFMLDCWNYDPYARKTPQGIMRDINQIFYQVYNSRLFNQYTAIIPSFDYERDNVSNSGGCSTDFSPLTSCTTLEAPDTLDQSDASEDVSKSSSVDSSSHRTNLKDGHYQAKNMFDTQTYRCITNRDEMSGQQDYSSDAFNSISSLQSIFELDKEWNLVLKGIIGEGYFGQVFLGELHHHYDEENPRRVAVKKMKREATRNDVAELDGEISTMLKLDHPNIVRVIGRIQEPELCLVLEHIEGGSLKSYLNIYKERVPYPSLVKYSLDIACGMAYLSEMKYVHRDLAARNILVCNPNLVKISDFGLARFLGTEDYYRFGSKNRELPIKWYAPESLTFNIFSLQSDVWSYGVTLFEMFSWGADPQLPGAGQTQAEMAAVLKTGIRLAKPLKCSDTIYNNIIYPCWQHEADDRPTFVELCERIRKLKTIRSI